MGVHLFYMKDREGAHLLYKGGHNKICALKGTKGGTKEGTFVLHNILYSILQELGEQLLHRIIPIVFCFLFKTKYVPYSAQKGAHLLYKGGHNKICALKGTKEGTKEGTFVLHNTLYSILQDLGKKLAHRIIPIVLCFLFKYIFIACTLQQKLII